MFSLKNHINNLQYSQRFYYSNYQFYNEYEQPKKYLNDISKITYSCPRKTTTQIVQYHRVEGLPPETRKIRCSYGEEEISMEEFLGAYIGTFCENNYSDFPDNKQQVAKNQFRITYFPSEPYLRAMADAPQKKTNWKKSLNSFEIINTLLDLQKETITHIMELNNNEQIANEQLDYYRHLLGFSELAYFSMFGLLKKEDHGVRILNNFNLLRMLIEQVFNSIMETQVCAYQLLYVPNVSIFGYFLNPTLCIVKNYITKDESFSKSETSYSESFQKQIPKIVFINLDGVQMPLNLQYLRSSYSNSLMYVSIFKEFQDVNEINDQVSAWHSKFVAKLISDCNLRAKYATETQKINSFGCPKVLAFPLSSFYVKTKTQQQKDKNSNNCYLSGTSAEISFLFENVIYEEIRQFGPHIIFISYNGLLNVDENNFNEIIRRLTLLCDHKIVLFTNFTTLFETRNSLSELVEYITNPQNEMQMQLQGKFESEPSDLVNIAKFVEDYVGYEIADIDVTQLFNNLGMFNKISCGAYSFQQKREIKPNEKFQAGYKYEYLGALAAIDEFSYLRKYCSGNVKAKALGKLLSMQRDKLLQANKLQTQFFSKPIDNAIKKMLTSQGQLSARIRYRLQKLKMSFETNQKDLHTFLEQKKKSILVQSIAREKITKIFTIPHTQPDPQLADIVALQLYMRNGKGDKEYILLDEFSQVIINQRENIILVLNYVGDQYIFYSLYGYLMEGTKEVEMFVLVREVLQENKYAYLRYSYYFDNGLLYLYWPCEWDAEEEAASLLLDLKYEPVIVHKLLIVSYKLFKTQPQSCITQYQAATNILCLPRYGSTMHVQNSTIFIMGGYYDNKNDYLNETNSGISIMKVDPSTKQFFIEDISKSVLANKLRPKANYTIVKQTDKQLLIYGGFGREFTNFYNIYSYVQYTFNMETFKLTVEKTQRQLASLDSPMSSRKAGRYEAVSFKDGSARPVKLESSGRTKHKFIMSKPNIKQRRSKKQPSSDVLSFMTDEYTTPTHQQPSSTCSLLQITHKIASIYSSSQLTPELYLTTTDAHSITRLQLLTQLYHKSSSLIAKDAVLPCEDDLVAMCMHPGGHTLYILAQLPPYTSLAYLLYSASLSNVSQVLTSQKLEFKKYFQFSQLYQGLEKKGLGVIEDGIAVVGGQPNQWGIREDYLIYENRGTVRTKLIKIEHPEDPEILAMPNPHILADPQNPQQLLLYSLILDNESHWQLKIQTLTRHPNSSSWASTISVSHLTTCALVSQHMYEIHPQMDCPRVVAVEKYETNGGVLKELCGELAARVVLAAGDPQESEYSMEAVRKMEEIIKENANNDAQLMQTELLKFNEKIHGTKIGTDPKLKQILMTMISATIAMQIESICLKLVGYSQHSQHQEPQQLHRFYIEDSRNRGCKYVGIGQLANNSIVFFRLKFDANAGVLFKDYNNTSGGMLYGRKLGTHRGNLVCGDENFVRRFIKEGDQCVHVDQIQPFETEVQHYKLNVQVSSQQYPTS